MESSIKSNRLCVCNIDFAYSIRFVAYLDSYEKAKRLSRKAEETSNFESDSDTAGGKRKRKTTSKKFLAESSDSSSGEFRLIYLNIQTT